MLHRHYRIITVIGLFLCLPVVATAQTAGLNLYIGDVAVWTLKSQTWKPAKLNQVIAVGDSIRTGADSRAELKMGDGSIHRIDENARIVVTEIKGKGKEQSWGIFVEIGRIWTNAVKMISGDSNRRVISANTQAAIRGTVYRVAVRPDRQTEVRVYEGQVRVSPTDSTGPVAALLDLAPAEGISPAEARAITNRLQTELEHSGAYQMVSLEQVDAALADRDLTRRGCLTEACIKELGRALNAVYVIVGNADKLGSTYSLDIRLIEVETGRIVKIHNPQVTGDVDQVLAQMRAITTELIRPPDRSASGPQRVTGPQRVSYQRWMEILDAMQRIVVNPDGTTEKSEFTEQDEAEDTWIQWNRTRDQNIERP